jgi:probable rRNA maturation factor
MISIENDNPLDRIQTAALKETLNKICLENSATLRSLVFVVLSDEQLLEMNKTHLDHDYYTDVITFDLSEDTGVVEGEVYMSIDRIKDNSKTFNKSTVNEFSRVAIHGLLHLIGYDDHSDEDKKIIRQKEDEYLNLLPY